MVIKGSLFNRLDMGVFTTVFTSVKQSNASYSERENLHMVWRSYGYDLHKKAINAVWTSYSIWLHMVCSRLMLDGTKLFLVFLLSPVIPCNIHPRLIPQKILNTLLTETCFQTSQLKSQQHCPGANGLTHKEYRRNFNISLASLTCDFPVQYCDIRPCNKT